MVILYIATCIGNFWFKENKFIKHVN